MSFAVACAPHNSLGLLIAAGFLLVISALPSGIVFCILEHQTSPQEWRSPVISGVAMFAVTVSTGFVLVLIGELLSRRTARATQPPSAVQQVARANAR